VVEGLNLRLPLIGPAVWSHLASRSCNCCSICFGALLQVVLLSGCVLAASFTMAAAPSTWRVALHGAVEPTFVAIKFDPAQHTSVGDVAKAAAAELDQGKVPQVRLALFRVSDEAAKPSWAQCNAAVDSPSSKIDLTEDLTNEAVCAAVLPNKAWFVLKIFSPAAAPAAGEFRADAPVLAPVVLPGAAAAESPPFPPPGHVVLRGAAFPPPRETRAECLGFAASCRNAPSLEPSMRAMPTCAAPVLGRATLRCSHRSVAPLPCAHSARHAACCRCCCCRCHGRCRPTVVSGSRSSHRRG